jgi:hypothetical protein
LTRLLELYGAEALNAALAEALQRGTPNLPTVEFLLEKHRREANRRPPLPVDLTDPELAALHVQPHSLSVYDQLSLAWEEEERSGVLSPGEPHPGMSHHHEPEASVGPFEAVDVLARVLVRHGGPDQEARRVAEGAGIASLLLLDGVSLAGDSLKVGPWHTRSFRGSRQLEVRLAIASGPDPNPNLKLAACPFGSNSGRRGFSRQICLKEGTRASPRDRSPWLRQDRSRRRVAPS